MPRPLRVLLDVTVFGLTQENLHIPHARAGIYRMVEQTVRTLGSTPGVAVTLCSMYKPDTTAAHVAAHPDADRMTFTASRRRRLATRLQARAAAEYRRAGAYSLRTVSTRAANVLVGVASRALDARFGGVGLGALARADVFHSPVYALPPRGGRLPGVRYVLTIHDLIAFIHPEFSWSGAPEWLREIVDSIGPDDHVLTVSESTRQDLLAARPSIAPERVRVSHLAADGSKFYRVADADRLAAVRARYGIPDAPYVLSVGTLEPRKNIAHLIRSFAALVRSERLDDLHLVLTGDRGWKFDAIFAEAGRLDGLEDRIVFTGYVDDADLAPLYSGALVFAFPSLYEGFGLPPLEAMQCGAPVIASNTSSMPEVVGDAGILVDPRDSDALAQAMLQVYRDGAMRDDLARRSAERAATFTWARYADRVIATYRDAR
ncbi:hypothetical protein tb265_43450 [Gemmatimonadetes bacterium T265]|nr:hypothetical protein tb265_43450 [Gemmatimonadetes bacterium T265]